MFKNGKGIIGQEIYPIQVVETKPGDVLLCHISEHMDLENCECILKELQKAFPDNTVLLVNEHVLKGINVIRPKNSILDLTSKDDLDEMLDNIMKECGPNDFLY